MIHFWGSRPGSIGFNPVSKPHSQFSVLSFSGKLLVIQCVSFTGKIQRHKVYSRYFGGITGRKIFGHIINLAIPSDTKTTPDHTIDGVRDSRIESEINLILSDVGWFQIFKKEIGVEVIVIKSIVVKTSLKIEGYSGWIVESQSQIHSVIKSPELNISFQMTTHF